MKTSSVVTHKLSVLGIRGKLIGLVVALVVIAGVCVGVAVSGLTGASTKSGQSASTFKVFNAERDAYEGWLTDDDQSNMYAAVVALKDPRQRQLANVTWQQAVQGYQQAKANLDSLASTVPTAALRAMVATLRSDLATYNGFSQQVVQYGQAGNPEGAVKVMTVGNVNISNKTQADFNTIGAALTKQAAAINA